MLRAVNTASGDLPPLGLIAGSRALPLMFAREARAMGRRVIAVGFEGETDPALAQLVDSLTWIRVGQLGRMIAALRTGGVQECVMLGQVAPKNLFDLRPDLRAMGLLWRLKERNAHTLFGGIAKEMEADGVQLVSAIPWLGRHMPGPGYLLGKALSEDESGDVSYGWGVAREVARLEIGQCVVVKRGTVLAVEGFEGTDACLQRGGELAGKDGGAVAIKVAKRGHDVRFDLPTIGPSTIEVCGRYGVRALMVEAGRTLLVDETEVRRLVKEMGVTLGTVGGNEDTLLK